MSRPDRQDEPGALFHIWTRGVARRSIHEGASDYDSLVERMGHERVQEHMRILAYCLMPNHFHTFGMSRNGNVSEALRWLKQGHAREFNRKRDRDGPLFQGRFRSRRVHGLPSRAALLHYIDHNPVRGGLVTTPAAWHFGSARSYLLGQAPDWLATDLVAADVEALTLRPLSPDSYHRAFYRNLDPQSVEWLIEQGMKHPRAFRGGWEILNTTDPDFSARWLLMRAKLADGRVTSVPLLHPDRLLAELAELRSVEGGWTLRCFGRRRCAWTVLTTGFLHDVCGLSQVEIAAHLDRGVGAIHDEMRRYRHLTREDADFRNRAAAIVTEIRLRTWPSG